MTEQQGVLGEPGTLVPLCPEFQIPTSPELSAPGPTPRVDAQLLSDFWDALVNPGEVREVRIPDTRRGPRHLSGKVVGYFDRKQAFVDALRNVTGADAAGVYITLNPVDPDLQARAVNRLKNYAQEATSDADILRLRHLLVDVDPVRKSGISATDSERDAALTVRDAVAAYLREEMGWPNPVATVESGNGGALLYQIDLENTGENVDLQKAVLATLAEKFTTPEVKIDASTSNPARLTKVVGTVAAKGDSTPDRPWRLATARLDTATSPVSREQLLDVVLVALEESPDASGEALASGTCHGPILGWDVQQVLQEQGVTFTEKRKADRTILRLDRCLTSSAHSDGAGIILHDDGGVGYRCFHASCSGKGWRDARVALGLDRGNNQPSLHRIPNTDVGDDQGGLSSVSGAPLGWPTLSPTALHGLAGDIVHALDPFTEADPAAVLVTFLVMFGNAVGRGPHIMIGDDRHGTNLFVSLVARTSVGRKGSSLAGPRRLMSLADPAWVSDRIQSGLSSGEGLIWAIRDEVAGINRQGQQGIIDAGVEDKRLLALEEELAAVLKVAQRQGNTITATMRQAWDARETLQSLTKSNAAKATAPHISILAHITDDELARTLTETDRANGLGNRFCWFLVRRSKSLPIPGRLTEAEAVVLGGQIADALDFGRQVGEVRRDDSGRQAWIEIYDDLTEAQPGLVGAMTARAAAQVVRLALVYALLDRSPVITADHVLAASALWQYSEASVRSIFGDATGDPIAERILSTLRRDGRLSREAIRALFGRHQSAERLDQALARLEREGLVQQEREETAGRPRTIWRLTDAQ